MPRRPRRPPRPKTLSREVGLGQRGINLIERVVLAMGSRWNPSNSTEVGIDGYVELFEPGSRSATGLHVGVQSKATAVFDGDVDTITFRCKADDIAYWLNATPPVILVVSKPDADEAYWLSTRAFFGDPERRGSTLATFNRRTQRLTERSYDALLEVACPRDQAVRRVPVTATEVLYSNLTPLRSYPSTLYIGRTTCDTYRQAWARLREGEREVVSPAWLIHERNVFSFVDLSRGRFPRIVEDGTVEEHATVDWANNSDGTKRRLFVQLLNRALRDDLGAIGIRFFEDDDVYAFKGEMGRVPRTQSYRSVRRASEVTVVQRYVSRAKDGREFPFLRHNAFSGRFRFLGGVWYLEILPTYRFTTDGIQKYRFHEDQLQGIKRLEGNRAVLSQVLLWNDVLCPEPSLFSSRKPMLTFDPPLDFQIDRGIPDADWGDVPDSLAATDEADFPLFAQALGGESNA